MQALRARVWVISFATLGAAAIMGATPSFAQFGGGDGAGAAAAQHNMKSNTQNLKEKPEAAPPPVLPGTKAAVEPAAPTASPADMSPTEALFDAINRGDLTAARDSVNRGANLDGRNELGLTPLDLSVDLGRNNISFMLMSMREEDSGARQDARAGTVSFSGDRHQRPVAAQQRAASRVRTVTAAAEAPEEPAVATPRVYSGDGGAPIPNAGFLGFNSK